MNQLPDLEAWAIFAKIAEVGSFVRAAEELSLSQGTVSKAISRLEKRLKVNLFHRTSRSLSLTQSGLAVLERASHILEEGRTIEVEVTEQSNSLRGPIRMTAPMSFGLSYLAPILPSFLSAHPDIKLDIDYDDELIDLVANRFDLAVRISTLTDSSLLARRLCDIRIHLVGSPDYFARYGKPQHPRDIAQHRALQYIYSRTGARWRFRHALHGEATQTVSTFLRVNNAEALLPALRDGLGLALQPEFMVWEDLQSGALETVMEDWLVDPISLYLITPPGRNRPERVQALMDFLIQHFSKEPWCS